MTPTWVMKGMYPWVPTEALPYSTSDGFNPIVGRGTAFPAETGWMPTADLYWQPKHLILNMQWQYTNGEGGDGQSGTIVVVGDERCARGRELVTRKDGAVSMEYVHDPGVESTVVTAGFLMEPDSRYIENRHWLKMVFSGRFTAASSTDHFTTDRGFPPIVPDADALLVGELEIVANPGRSQSIYLLPIWRYGPNALIGSVNAQITRRRWQATEL